MVHNDIENKIPNWKNIHDNRNQTTEANSNEYNFFYHSIFLYDDNLNEKAGKIGIHSKINLNDYHVDWRKYKKNPYKTVMFYHYLYTDNNTLINMTETNDRRNFLIITEEN